MPGAFHDYLLSQHEVLGNAGKFKGDSTIPFAGFTGCLLTNYSAKKVFDFGSGVGLEDQDLHRGHIAIRQHMPISSEIVGYEPCHQKEKSIIALNQLILAQSNSYNAVISFDVIEHLDIYDSALIVPEIFRIAQDLVIVNISCIPAAKNLPNGRNAHTSIFQYSTWAMMFWQEALRTRKNFALFCTVSQTQDVFIHNIPVERYHNAFDDKWFEAPPCEEQHGITSRSRFSCGGLNLSQPMVSRDRSLNSHISELYAYKY